MFNLSTKILTKKIILWMDQWYFDMMSSKLYCYTNSNWIEVIYGIFDDINIKRKEKIINIKSRV